VKKWGPRREKEAGDMGQYLVRYIVSQGKMSVPNTLVARRVEKRFL
jgi:hypothetical protein